MAMTERVLGPTGGRRRKRLALLVPFIALAALVLVAMAGATGAVGTAAGFEDDDGNLAPEAPINFDWNSFATTAWTGTAPYLQSEKVFEGWTFKGISDAEATNSDSAFAGGTKQDDDCPTVNTGKAPNKDDLKRIYLASKVVSGRTYLMLAWVRIPQNTTSPSAHIGFEFNKGTDGPCGGSSDGLVKRVAGDMLIVYDFEGGATDTPVITLRRWVTSGACEVGSKSPPCWGTATNLTALGFAEAKVNTFGSVTDQIAPSPPATLGTNEFGEAGIDLTGAGVFTAGTCESFGTAFGVSRSSGNSGTAQMKDLIGPADFQLANCGTVIIHKETDPDGDTTTNFGFTTNVTTTPSTTTSPFSLMDGGTKTILNVNAGSNLNVTEDDPGPNYALDSIDCDEDDTTVPASNYSTNTTTRAVTFSLAGGEVLECTFTNKLQRGAIKILKNSTKGGAVANAGAVFSYDSSSVTDNGAGDGDSDVGEVCVSGLAPGDYTVNETSPPSGYGGASQSDLTATAVVGTNCTDNLPTGSGVVTFTNAPLADIQVNFRDGGSGETSAVISCDNSTGTSDTTAASGWDTSETVTGIEAPTLITCTIDIDP
jgi:hypothetical protein